MGRVKYKKYTIDELYDIYKDQRVKTTKYIRKFNQSYDPKIAVSSKDDFKMIYTQIVNDADSKGLSARQIAEKIAKDQLYIYSSAQARAVREATGKYKNEQGEEVEGSIYERLMGKKFNTVAFRSDVKGEFYKLVREHYDEFRKEAGAKFDVHEASHDIAVTFFGSP